MKFLGSIWSFLKGKKTIITAAAHVVTTGLVATGHLDPALGKAIETGITIAMAGALGDKVIDKVRELKNGEPVEGRK